MDNENRVVFRQETFNDLAVRELAKGRSACICRIQFGRCTKDECKTCSIYKKYNSCYNAMSDYDKSRLNEYISECYAEDSATPEAWMSYKRLKAYIIKWVVAMFVGLMLFGIALGIATGEVGDRPNRDTVSEVGDKPSAYVPVGYRKVSPESIHPMILSIMYAVQATVYDLNDDGKVNCIDHAVLFKMLWDEMYPRYKYNCEIVRNKSPQMHHLFIRVFDYEVEPWAPDPQYYSMEDNWLEETYLREYNIYGETTKWLREVKR